MKQVITCVKCRFSTFGTFPIATCPSCGTVMQFKSNMKWEEIKTIQDIDKRTLKGDYIN